MSDLMDKPDPKPKTCVCGHKFDDHFGPTLCCDHDDCTCIAYEWDGDEGGAAVTRSVKR